MLYRNSRYNLELANKAEEHGYLFNKFLFETSSRLLKPTSPQPSPSQPACPVCRQAGDRQGEGAFVFQKEKSGILEGIPLQKEERVKNNDEQRGGK
jgi:hypothetical protein